MTFDDMMALAQTATKLVAASGLFPGVGPLVAAAAETVAIVKRNVETSKDALAAKDLDELNAILEPLHARILVLSSRLDQAAGQAAKL